MSNQNGIVEKPRFIDPKDIRIDQFASLREVTPAPVIKKQPPAQAAPAKKPSTIQIPSVNVDLAKGGQIFKSTIAGLLAKKAAENKFAEEERLRKETERKEKKQEVGAFAKWMADEGLRGILEIEKEVAIAINHPETPLSPDEVWEAVPEGYEITFRQMHNAWRSSIDSAQGDEDPEVSLPLILTEASFWLSMKEFADDKEIASHLQQLVKNQILQSNPTGNILYRCPITRRDSRFSLNKRFEQLDSEDRTLFTGELNTALQNQANSLKNRLEELKREAERKLRDEATNPAIDLFDDQAAEWKEEGSFLMSTTNGFVLVKAIGNEIEALGAIGLQEEGFNELAALEEKYNTTVIIDRRTLKTRSGKLRKANPEPDINIPGHIKEKGRWINASLFLWHACRDALSRSLAHGWQEPLDPQEFYTTINVGFFTLHLDHFAWKLTGIDGKPENHETEVRNLKVVLERFRDNLGQTRIRVITWPFIHYSLIHQDFLERASCLANNGYVVRAQGQCELFFLTRLLAKYRKNLNK